MTIEYRPSNVGNMLSLPSAEKRFKSRDGYAVFIDQHGQHARQPISGGLLEVNAVALDHERAFPDHTIAVFEHGCGGSGVPSTLPVSITDRNK